MNTGQIVLPDANVLREAGLKIVPAGMEYLVIQFMRPGWGDPAVKQFTNLEQAQASYDACLSHDKTMQVILVDVLAKATIVRVP